MKRTKIWPSGGKCLVYAGLFLLLSVRGHCKVIRCISDFVIFDNFVSRNGWSYSETDRNFGPRATTSCIQGTFVSYMFDVILRSFGAFTKFSGVSTTFFSQKKKKKKKNRNRSKFGPRVKFLVYTGHL